MSVPSQRPPVNPASFPAPTFQSFSPDDPVPSRRAGERGVREELRQAGPTRLHYRVRIVWSDPTKRGGQTEEIVRFGDPRKLIDLLRRVRESPERPLVSIRSEAMARPRWYEVPLDYVRWRAAQRDRRDEIKAIMEKRAAAQKGGAS